MTEFEELTFDDGEATERTGWPVALGIVAIVFGAMGLLAGCANFGFLIFVEPLTTAMADATGQPPETMGFAGIVEWKGWVAASSVVSMLVAVPLRLGGIGLSRRRPSSRAVLMTWAIVKMVLVPAGVVLALFINRTQFEVAQEHPATAGMSGEFSKMMGDVIAIVSALWGWALPVFVLIWFNRAKIKRETATWSDSGSGAADALSR